jgi:hypothetical protein
MSDLTNKSYQQIASAFATLYSPGYVGVGDGETAFSPAQTDNQGTNKERNVCSTATAVGNATTWVALFGSSEALFEWTEIAIFDALAGGNMHARKLITGVGEKPNTQEWEVEAVVTYADA